MEKPSLPSSPSSSSLDSSKELQCVGRLEIVRPKPVGFLCGSIPVPTDKSFHAVDSALVPSSQKVSAPRYRMLPTETDLNTLPVVSNLPEKVLPIGAVQSKTTGELLWEGDAVSSNIRRKCEALAVTGLVEYGDEIDVIAPADILKQIFKMPYSKARLSIAVRRIGQTLVLNSGPDVEEGEKLVRKHGTQSKCADQSLFLNFAMHSVRMEACDCPPSHHSPEGQSKSSVLPGGSTSQSSRNSDDVVPSKEMNHGSDYSEVKQGGFLLESKKNKKNKARHPIKKTSHVSEKSKSTVHESEKHKRVRDDGFLRALFWQFHNFRMLLGSDLLLFSNEKYLAVSLHLWDVTRQVTPLTWLEAWLDNVMASVPELAICYHENGVVQGYELLKTDEIFLLKGISEDGTPAFHPHVVQQNGLSVLRFLQKNCKQDPGAYWLYKSAEEDMIQLFDLSVIPDNQSSSDYNDDSSSLPPLHRACDSSFSLGTLLYRVAHRLSLSMAPNRRAKCARFFRQCLEFLEEPDHLVVRASAHEEFARLLLTNVEELELSSESLTIDHEATVAVLSQDPFDSFPEYVVDEGIAETAAEYIGSIGEIGLLDATDGALEVDEPVPFSLMPLEYTESRESLEALPAVDTDESIVVCEMPKQPTTQAVQTVGDPISTKLAAVHHVSQAIKSLRGMRQLQPSDAEFIGEDSIAYNQAPAEHSVCACGNPDCIEVCDIREWLPTSKIDHKLWKLVLLLGESYLALGQAYKEDKQLHRALKIVELASSVYGSMPQELDDTQFLSPVVKYSSPRKSIDEDGKLISYVGNVKGINSGSNDEKLAFEHMSSTYLFWAKAWTLVGDVYVDFHFMKGTELLMQTEKKNSLAELRMPGEVVKEVQRLKKRLGQSVQNCSSCSLVNCSCRSDRASSGSSASSSSGNSKPSVSYGRKHRKKPSKKVKSPIFLDSKDDPANGDMVNKNMSDIRLSQPGEDGEIRAGDSGISVEQPGDNPEALANDTSSLEPCHSADDSKDGPKNQDGGIFKYLRGTIVGGTEDNLSTARTCYEEARNALAGVSSGSLELQSLLKKTGWVCNEIGRKSLERNQLKEAECAFADAISAFKEVSDHTNIILINCNLGHGRRALAEEMVTKTESLRFHAIFQKAHKQALEAAKFEYRESLRYYGAAKAELNAVLDEAHFVSVGLRNEVCTQLAHTYLRLGMLLAREDITAEVFENGVLEDISVLHVDPRARKTRKDASMHEISANDAIREALSLYESLGEIRKQEAAYAYFQLACHQRDCCLKFLETDRNSKGENNGIQRAKQYASLAERNWQKSVDFYAPETHPTMYLTIIIERSALSMTLSGSLHSQTMLESALCRLLEARHVSESVSDTFQSDSPSLHTKFWDQLQTVLKKMLTATLSETSKKPSPANNTQPQPKQSDAGKLRELYKMSLKSTDFNQLHSMHALWTS
ncbi:Erythroid differentiation-related factor 1 [Linum perenne]